MEPSWSDLEASCSVLEPYWSVLERLGGVLKRLGALLQAIWRDAEDIEKTLVFSCLDTWPLLEDSWRPLGSVLERVRVVLKRLEASCSNLGGFLMRIGASWRLEASWSRLGGVLEPLEDLLEPRKTS